MFSATLPKLIDVAFTLTPAAPVVDGESVMLNCALVPPACAVIVAVWVVVTLVMAALKPALMAPDLTVTRLGTVTAGLLLESATYVLVRMCAAKYTEQASVPGPLYAFAPHDTRLSVTADEVLAAATMNARIGRIFRK